MSFFYSTRKQHGIFQVLFICFRDTNHPDNLAKVNIYQVQNNFTRVFKEACCRTFFVLHCALSTFLNFNEIFFLKYILLTKCIYKNTSPRSVINKCYFSSWTILEKKPLRLYWLFLTQHYFCCIHQDFISIKCSVLFGFYLIL